MPTVQKNQLLVWDLLRLSARDAPLAESAATTLPSSIGIALVPSGVSPSAHATRSVLLPFSSYPSAFAQFDYRVVASSAK